MFISSTFRDMHAERDHLVKVVVPKLRQWCELHRLYLVDIDLRWGVTEAEVNDGKAIDICLREIDGSRPFFVCMLGERYGFVPEPLPAEDQYQFASTVQVANKSITHLEIIHAVEQPLTRRQPPASGSVCSHAFFYFRRPECVPRPEQMVDQFSAAELAEYERAFFEPRPARPGEFDRRAQLGQLKASIRERFGPLGRVFDYSAHFDPTATNPEDDRGLKGRLVELTAFGERIEADLRQAIEGQFAEQFSAGSQPADPVVEEQALHGTFAENRARVYILRGEVEQQLTAYVADDDRRPLVLSGPPGSGKSAILAHWVQQFASQETTSAPTVVARFIGATPASTSLPGLLRGICQELVRILDLQEEVAIENPDGSTTTRTQTMEIPADPVPLQRKWPIVLAAAASKGQVVLVIDALNQMDRSAHPDRLHWLPHRLPTGLHLLVSCLDHGSSRPRAAKGTFAESPDWLAALRRRDIRELPVKQLDSMEQVEIIRQVPSVFCKTLDPVLVRELVGNDATRNPLFLTVALEELRVFGGFQTLIDRIQALPTLTGRSASESSLSPADRGPEPPTETIDNALDGLFGQILDRLDRECHVDDLVTTMFRLLASAKEGLSEQELLELLARLLPAEDATRRSGEVEVVLRQVRGYLMRKGPLVDFYHRSFWKAVRAKYLTDPGQLEQAHSALANYFSEQASYVAGPRDGSTKLRRVPNERKISELPWQLLRAGRLDDLANVLCDLQFIEAKCACGMHHQLVEDFNLALAAMADNEPAPSAAGSSLGADVQRYVKQLHQASAQWNESLDGVVQSAMEQAALDESSLWRIKNLGLFLDSTPDCPQPVAQVARVPTWSESRIRADIERQRRQPRPLDRVAAFAAFVRNEGYLLRDHARQPGFVVNHAYNSADAGPVFEAAKALARAPDSPPMFLRPAALRPAWNPHPRRLQSMTGHVGPVSCLAMTPDGRWALSAGADLTLRFWDLQSGACLHVLDGLTEQEVLMAMTPDARRAVSINGSRQLRIWDLVSAECLHVLPAEGELLAITADGRRVLSGIPIHPDDSNAFVFAIDIRTGDRVNLKLGEFDVPAIVRKMGYFIAGNLSSHAVFVAGNLSQLGRWEARQGVLARISGDWIRAVAFTQDGERAFVAVDDRIDVWDLKAGVSLEPLKGTATALSVTADGRSMLLALGDTLELWNLQRGLDVPAFKDEAPTGDELMVTADGRHVVSRNSDSLRVWDVETVTTVRELSGHTHHISAMRMLPDGCRIVTGSEDGSLRLWDWTTGECLSAMKQPRCVISALALAPDGRRVVTGGLDALKWVTTLDPRDRQGLLVVWDLTDGRRLLNIQAHEGDVLGVHFTRDGRHIVSVGKEDSKIGLWDGESGEHLRTLESNSHGTSLWSPSGRQILSVNFDGDLRVWDLESGGCGTIPGPIDGNICLSDCGSRVVFVDKQSVLRVHDVTTGQQLLAVPNIARMFGLVRRGTVAVVTNKRDELRILELETGRSIVDLADPEFQLRRLCAAPDGDWALAVSRTGLHLVWDFARGERIAALQLPTESFELKLAGRFVLAQQNLQRWEILEPTK